MIYLYCLIGFVVYSYGIPAAMNAYDECFDFSTHKAYKLMFGFGWPLILITCLTATIIGVLLMNLSDCYLAHFCKKDN